MILPPKAKKKKQNKTAHEWYKCMTLHTFKKSTKFYCLLIHNYITIRSIKKSTEVIITDVTAEVISRKEEEIMFRKTHMGAF